MDTLRQAPPSTDEIEIVLSDRVEDVGEVLRVVHDGFVEAGFTLPQPSGMRLHASYLNPGTVFALARIDGEPVGAAVVVVDGPFGLPSDRAFAEENDALRSLGPDPIHECGSFVVRAQWRRHTRRVFVRAIAALTRIALVNSPCSPVVITASPETERFYGAILGMRRLSEPRPLYGAPALLMHPGSVADMARHCRRGDSSGQRAMDRLIRDAPLLAGGPARRARPAQRLAAGARRGAGRRRWAGRPDPPAGEPAPVAAAVDPPRRGRRTRRRLRGPPIASAVATLTTGVFPADTSVVRSTTQMWGALRAADRGAIVLGAAAVAVFVVAFCFLVAGVISGTAGVCFGVGCVTVFAALGMRATRQAAGRSAGVEARFWRLMSYGFMSWALGCVPYYVFLAAGGDVASPAAWSQIGFLLAYPFWYFGLWKLRQPALVESRRGLFEGFAIEVSAFLMFGFSSSGRSGTRASRPRTTSPNSSRSRSTSFCWPPSTTRCGAPR